MPASILAVRPQDLAALDEREAVARFAQLLWAEACADGIATNLIDVPQAINVRDGGVDAEVRSATQSSTQGLIKSGLTCYQIKTGDVSLTAPAKVREILCKKESTTVLNDRVKACLDVGGTLVVVHFGRDTPDEEDQAAVKAFKDALVAIDTKYANASVEVWNQNRLIGFLTRFPTLAWSIKQLDRDKFSDHKSWDKRSQMDKQYFPSNAQRDEIRTIQTELRKPGTSSHVRIYGPPGIGKTRIALEATRPDDLLPLVAYFDSAADALISQLVLDASRHDNTSSAIIVVDECDRDGRARLWDRLGSSNGRMKLVTIYPEFDNADDVSYCRVPPLPNEQIAEIFAYYGVNKEDARRWIPFCGGSPRVAHIMGKGLRDHPEDLLKEPGDTNAWDRFIRGVLGAENFERKKCLLRYMALYRRFGWDGDHVREGQAIQSKAAKADAGITWQFFTDVVRKLRDAQILQGQTTLYMSPELLQIWLWVEWWESYGHGFHLEEFLQDQPDSLHKWYFEMFEYARESGLATKVVKGLVDPGGPFEQHRMLETPLGARFLYALAKADPEAALAHLERVLGERTPEDLKAFKEGRRETVDALRSIAVERPLFSRAARLLLALGEAENEGWANNASGIFTTLFTNPWHPKIASNAAPLLDRLPVVEEALRSTIPARQRLAIRACDAALETHHFVRDVGFEYNGIRPEPTMWAPRDMPEWKQGFGAVWSLLCGSLAQLQGDARMAAVKVLLTRARGLVKSDRFPDMTSTVVATLREVAALGSQEKRETLEATLKIIHFDQDEMTDENRAAWLALRDELTGSDFPSLMRRYVGMRAFTDNFDDQGNHVDQAEPKIRELAAEAAAKPELLDPELPWLATKAAENGFRFGYALATRDNAHMFLPKLVGATDNAGEARDLRFLGGYLRGVFEVDASKWEGILDDFSAHEGRLTWVGQLTSYSGYSDRAAERIIRLVEAGILVPRALSESNNRLLTASGAATVVRFLLKRNGREATIVALEIADSFFRRHDHGKRPALRRDLLFDLLTHPTLLAHDEHDLDTMAEHYWAELAKAYVEAFPDDDLRLASALVESLGTDSSVLDIFHSAARAVLAKILRAHPRKFWDMLSPHLDPKNARPAFRIARWLRGEERGAGGEGSLFAALPEDALWRWVDQDPEVRPWFLAEHVPPALFRGSDKPSLAREVLVRYGNRKDVRNSFAANNSTESFGGSATAHYRSKKDFLLAFRREEANANVVKWIDEYVADLDRRIAHSLSLEERLGWGIG